MKKILTTILILCLFASLGLAQGHKDGAHKGGGLIQLQQGAAQGDIIYWNGTAWTKLVIGSNGEFLTTDGSTPSWGAGGASADSAWNIITLGNDAENVDGKINLISANNSQVNINIDDTDVMNFVGASGGYYFQGIYPIQTEYGIISGAADIFVNPDLGSTGTLTLANAGDGDFVVIEAITTINEAGADYDFRVETAGEDSALVVDGADGDVYMEGLGTGTGTALSRVAGTDEIVEESSSMRFKDNISDWDIDPSALMGLKPRQFDWNDKSAVEGLHDYGMIAEEVGDVLPEAIQYKDGEVQAWSQPKLIALLVATVQSQQKQIDELKKKIK